MVKQLRALMAMFLLCLSVLTVGAMAQTSTTGSIEGDVVDVNGAVVPGVTITVTSPNLIRAQSATTNDSGRYAILNLPPGRYSVTVESIKGFSAYERKDVEVNLSKSSTVDIQLQPAGASATVEVTATGGSTVDVTSNTSGTNVSTEQFSNFPTQRTVQSLYTIAPTVARSGLRDASGRDRDPSVGGSSGPENNYILDGVNTTDPAFGGSGANLPFEFVQEVEVKTGAYGAEYGKTTGGIFNVITKSGGNTVRGDVFAYGTTKGFVRKTTSFPLLGSAPSGFSEVDAGFDIGGPIIKDKLWFFGAFNPQNRKNYFLTQYFKNQVNNKITTPFYAGKITYSANQNNTLTFSTFGDFTKQTGFLFGGSGFGDFSNQSNFQNIFNGKIETGGHNYTARLNSTIKPTMIGEFSFGAHFQRANTIPLDKATPLVSDSFAVVLNNAVLTPVNTTARTSAASNYIAYVDGRGGVLQRSFLRQGFGLFSNQDRNRFDAAARMQNIVGPHTFKYGFEYSRNIYKINTISTGQPTTFPDTLGLTGGDGNNAQNSYRVTNNFGVCTVQGSVVACPASALTSRVNALITAKLAPTGITSATTNSALTSAQLSTNPFLVLSSVRVRDFRLIAPSTHTDIESFYIQDDWKMTKDFQFNYGFRWDLQQAYGAGSFSYLKLNNLWHDLQPRLGVIYDFTHQGKGKIFANYARFLETPLPLDLNVRAGSDTTQTDKNINVSTLNAPASAYVTADIGNLGSAHTPIDADLKPQTVNELTAGAEYEVRSDLSVGVRGIYRAQGSVIEDGSFDDGDTYFLFNPGESATDREAGIRPETNFTRFGRARRYYRALEITANKRFTRNFQFISSYVFSSLTGNYEGLFRNDNGQSDPNITSLFDLVSLLKNTYGRLPNDRPHQFKFNGSYQTPFKLMVSGNYYIQSGIPFNQLVPHPVYGNNEGFAVPRGTAINPITGRNRTPTTFNLDLGAYYPIQLGENRQLRFQADWFNVTNEQRAIRQDETFSINSGIPGAGFIQFANPNYGTGTIFQFPTSLRLGVKLQF